MGAALQTAGAAELATELACCACSSVCGLIARNASTRAKFRYWSLLLMATVTCIVLLVPGLRQKIYKIPNFCNKVVSIDTCDKLIGFNAVYRILFSLTVFHFVLAISTIRVDRVKSCRARFNNGLWMFKMGLIMGITVGSFYIPKQTGFFRIWMYVSLTGGFMFAMFQIILVIDFGHSWSLSWAAKLETGYTKLWYLAMSIVTFIMFAMSFVAAGSFYLFFTHPPDIKKCHANVFYIAFITIQCFVASLVSITPTVQRELLGAGLLQSSVVIMYTMYLTFNTLIAEPDSFCNPLGSLIVEYDSFTGVSGQTIFGCMVTLSLLVFAFTVRTNTSYLGKYGLALAESEEFALQQYYEDKHKEGVEQLLETGGKEVLLDEYVGYNYSFFHLVMSLASLHILMVITNWHSPDENSNLKKLVKNWASVWVQMASSFVCILVFIWFLVTPLVKRVWGPIFGVYQIEQNKGDRYTGGKINEGAPEKEDGHKKYSKCIDDKTNLIKTKSIDRQPEHEVFDTREIDVNTCRTKASKQTQDNNVRTRKAPSVNYEETKSHGFSRRNSFRMASSIIDRSDSLYSYKGTDPKEAKNSRKYDEVKERRKDKMEKENYIKYKSNESIVSALSNFVSRKRQEARKTNKHEQTFKRNKQDDIQFRKRKKYPESPLHLSRWENSNHTRDTSRDKVIHSRKHSAHIEEDTYCAMGEKITENMCKSKLEEEDSVLQQRINDYNKSVEVLSNMASFDSLAPNTFSKKAQNPDVAKEILKLQWKILRSQAKMVKIQERIIRLQHESEADKERTNAQPGYRNMIENTESTNMQKMHRKKELG